MVCSNLEKECGHARNFDHDFFGKDAFDIAAGKLGLRWYEREAFLLSNQGPDPSSFSSRCCCIATLNMRRLCIKKFELLLFYARRAIAPLPPKTWSLAPILQISAEVAHENGKTKTRA